MAADRLSSTCLPGLNTTLAARRQPPISDLFALLDRCSEVLVLSSSSFDYLVTAHPAERALRRPAARRPWLGGGDWRPDGEGPLVLVAASSIYQRQTDLLRRAAEPPSRRGAEAWGQLQVRGVVTTGRAVDPEDIPAPDNVRVVRAAPHRQVLAEAAAVITHAGHGRVLMSLAAGVPLVCMPSGDLSADIYQWHAIYIAR